MNWFRGCIVSIVATGFVFCAALWPAIECAADGEAVSTTIGSAKLLPTGTPVEITNAIVSAAWENHLYIQDEKRVAGIRVGAPAHGLLPGAKIRVEGAVGSDESGELFVDADSLVPIGSGAARPLGMRCASLGGAEFGDPTAGAGQWGITGAYGLNNVGLLVRTTGAYTHIDNQTFTLNDGSGVEVRCETHPSVVANPGWLKVAVTGISSIRKNGEVYERLLRVTSAEPILSDPLLTIRMVHVPAGSFLMGSSLSEPYFKSDELPQHEVYLPDYWIGQYEVTRREYRQFMNAGGYGNQAYWSDEGWNWKEQKNRTEPDMWTPKPGYELPVTLVQTEDHPVVGVSYYEAEAFSKWAGGHLPTEAQWEKAARWDGHPRLYPWGDEWDAAKCNYGDFGFPFPEFQNVAVGSYPEGASPCGAHDMAGNVWEWCADWYASYPGSQHQFDHTGSYRILRGGGWSVYDYYYRCAFRLFVSPDVGWYGSGFRLVRESAAP